MKNTDPAQYSSGGIFFTILGFAGLGLLLLGIAMSILGYDSSSIPDSMVIVGFLFYAVAIAWKKDTRK